jgi:competence protein ComEA
VLPLPRRRIDPDAVRARLRALAGWPPEDDELSDGPPRDASLGELLTSGEAGPVVVGHASLRAVVGAVAATALATWMLVHLTVGGAPSAVQVVPGSPSAAVVPSTAAPSAVGASASPLPTDLVVQVVGEVRRPGLVRLAAGARVADAVRAAGGLAPGGGSGGLNLARLVVDGEQIVVSPSAPTVSSGGSAATASGASSSGSVVDLNSASESDLDTLPGVGPVMAGRILEWRTAHGRFTSVDQLRQISGIGARTFERLSPLVRV